MKDELQIRNAYDVWVDTLVKLLHIRQHATMEAKPVITQAKYEVNLAMAGGKRFYRFSPEEES